MSRLRPELLSLIHHVELNRAGWWQRALTRVVLFVLWSYGSVNRRQLAESMGRELHIDLDPELLRSSVNELVTSEVVVELPGGLLKIAEKFNSEFEANLGRSEGVEKRAAERFQQLAAKHQVQNSSKLWDTFNDEFLVPFVRESGANVYRLIQNGSMRIDLGRFPTFLRRFPDADVPHIVRMLDEFFDPKDSVVRAYVLSYLNSYFFLESFRLDQNTIDAVAKAPENRPRFTLILDTNFLFSILQLHDNPSNEAALRLQEIVGKLGTASGTRFFVFPITLDETKRVLKAIRDYTGGIHLTPNMAEALQEVSASGIQRRMAEEAQRLGRKINPTEYIAPFLSNLTAIVRNKGVEIFNEDLSNYSTAHGLASEILERQHRLNVRPGPRRRPKNYESVEHDVVLWHFLNSKRKVTADGILDAEYWIVTLDNTLIRYDGRKARDRRGNAPLCVHPTTLIQMLQFWVPRDESFEAAMISSLRLPFLFREFDAQAEKVTLRILQALDRYDGIEDLSPEVITSVLVSDILRQRIEEGAPQEQVHETLESVLLTQNVQLFRDAQESTKKAELLLVELADARVQHKAEQDRWQEERGALEREHAAQLKEAEKSANKRIELLEQDTKTLKSIVIEQQEARARAKGLRAFMVRWLAAPVSGVALFVAGSGVLTGAWRISLILGFGLSLAWLSLLKAAGRRSELVFNTRIFQVFDSGFRRSVAVFLGFCTVASLLSAPQVGRFLMFLLPDHQATIQNLYAPTSNPEAKTP